MSELGDACQSSLLSLFALEASELLSRIDAGLLVLNQAPVPGQSAPRDSILMAAHTLKGAARSIGMHHLEWLCVGLENVFAAASRSELLFSPDQCELLQQAAGLARTLAEKPTARSCNLTVVMMKHLDLMLVAVSLPESADATESR